MAAHSSTADVPFAAFNARLSLKIVTAVAAVVTVVMLLQGWLRPDVFAWREAVLHTLLVTFSCSVLLYFWMLRPLEVRLLAGQLELEAARDRAEHLARIDPLTGVVNRRAFFEHFEREWDRASRYSTPLTCVLINLDLFRQTNDAHGHLAGDAALRKIGQLLRSMCRSSDWICRLGGEEFCILLPETAESEAAELAERIREAISEQAIDDGIRRFYVTGSFGVAQRDAVMTVPDKLLEAADRALLHSKQQGRNRVTAAAWLAAGTAPLATQPQAAASRRRAPGLDGERLPGQEMSDAGSAELAVRPQRAEERPPQHAPRG